MADGRSKDVNWRVTREDGTIQSVDHAILAVLMDLRDELKLINNRLQCHETMAIPRMLKRISANTAKPRKPKAV